MCGSRKSIFHPCPPLCGVCVSLCGVCVCVASGLCCLPQLKEAVTKLQDDQSMEIEMLKKAYTVTLRGG